MIRISDQEIIVESSILIFHSKEPVSELESDEVSSIISGAL